MLFLFNFLLIYELIRSWKIFIPQYVLPFGVTMHRLSKFKEIKEYFKIIVINNFKILV